MEVIVALLLLAALVLFLVSAFGTSSRYNLQSLGLACIAGAMLLTGGALASLG